MIDEINPLLDAIADHRPGAEDALITWLVLYTPLPRSQASEIARACVRANLDGRRVIAEGVAAFVCDFADVENADVFLSWFTV